LKEVTGLTEVAKLTGPGAINDTQKFGVAGTDLGHMINMGEKTYFVFGDTFGVRDPDSYGGQGEDWRSNLLAVTTDGNPADGITFDTFIADDKGHAIELIPSRKINRAEITTIPTYGIAVGETMYIYYMSVNYWGSAGIWYTNHSGVYKSTDDGQTWSVVEGLRWHGESDFIQVAPYKIRNEDGSTDIYFWTTRAGRYGPPKLMKVPETEIEQLGSYRYFTGTDAEGAPVWSEDSAQAAPLFADTVGESSVAWNPFLERWIITYLRGGGHVVIREGINPWGPWGEPITLMSQSDFPALYGPYMNPRYVENNGETIYFTISNWGPYNVFWMKAKLVKQ
jgi:hypothetical protein